MPLLSKRTLNKLIAALHLPAAQEKGQNFIISPKLAQMAVDKLELDLNTDSVVEIGPGFGALSDGLIQRSKRVFLIDSEQACIDYLFDHYKNRYDVFRHSLRNIHYLGKIPAKGQVNLLAADFLDIPLPTATKLISNVPFPASVEFIAHLACSEPLERYVLIVQKEFVEHLLASPGGAHYTFISPIFQLFFQVESVEDIPPKSYFPPPAVHTQLLCFVPQREKFAFIQHREKFVSFARLLFSQKNRPLAFWDRTNSAEKALLQAQFPRFLEAIEDLSLSETAASKLSASELSALIQRSLSTS